MLVYDVGMMRITFVPVKKIRTIILSLFIIGSLSSFGLSQWSPYSTSVTPVVEDTREDAAVYFVQAALMLLGYNPGKIDGMYGSQSIEAVKRFQAKYGIEATGEVNNVTYKKLLEIFSKMMVD
jgi:peptidoglycan hydrolase-like protein with peptidoglycan-binding domain